MQLAGFVGQSYTLDSLNADCQDAVNLYPESIESGTGMNRARLAATPGLHKFTTLPKSPVRAVWAGEGRLFAVAGTNLYEVYADGTYTDRGSVGDDAAHTPALIFPNGNQLFIISAGLVYCENGSGPTKITFSSSKAGTVKVFPYFGECYVYWLTGDQFDSTMEGNPITINGVAYTVFAVYSKTMLGIRDVVPGAASTAYSGVYAEDAAASSGAFLDGYFIYSVPNTRQINISALMNGLSWDPLDFALKEGYPDAIAAILSDHRVLWLFGSQTTEIWNNTGAADFPLTRDSSGFIMQGLSAPHSPVSLAESVYWIGGDARGGPVAWRARGYTPERVSTHAVEQAWEGYTTVADAVGFAMSYRGHAWWVLTFPTADATWVYDATTGIWFEWLSWDGAALHRAKVRNHAYVGLLAHGASPALAPKHFMGSHTTGDIYEAAPTFYDDDGANRYYRRTCPHLNDDGKWHFCHRLQLEMESGTSLAGQPEQTVTLCWSDDHGHVFNTPRAAGVGVKDAFAKRVYWPRLGRFRDRVFRLTEIGKAKVCWINAYLELT